ncbi:MAG: hypothetical protein ACI957_002979, partial [Verrucomicrobiales bacterium]
LLQIRALDLRVRHRASLSHIERQGLALREDQRKAKKKPQAGKFANHRGRLLKTNSAITNGKQHRVRKP